MSVSGIELDPHVASASSTFELDEKAENLTSEVDDGVSTQISLKPAIEERSIIRTILDVGIWNGISKSFKITVAEVRLKSYKGSKKLIVDQLLLQVPIVRDADRKNIDRLSSLYILEECAIKLLRGCSSKEHQSIDQLVWFAFESLPASLISAIYSRLPSDHSTISYNAMRNTIFDVIHTFPSTVLRMLEQEMIVEKDNDVAQRDVVRRLEEISVSDIEPNITKEFIDSEVSRISQQRGAAILQENKLLEVPESVTSEL